MVSLTFPAAGTKPWGATNNANLTALNEGKVENADFEAYKTQVSTSLSSRAVKADVDAALAAKLATSTYNAFLTTNAANLDGKLATTTFTQFQSDLVGTLAGKSATGHVHSALDITTGLFAPERLGLGSANQVPMRSAAGIVAPALVSSAMTASTIAYRTPTGQLVAAAAVNPTELTQKAYVDGLIATKVSIVLVPQGTTTIPAGTAAGSLLLEVGA